MSLQSVPSGIHIFCVTGWETAVSCVALASDRCPTTYEFIMNTQMENVIPSISIGFSTISYVMFNWIVSKPDTYV
jgi:hypothetical protein